MRLIGVRTPQHLARSRNRLGYAFTVPTIGQPSWSTVGGIVSGPVTGQRFRVTRVEHLHGNDLHPLNPGGYVVALVDVEPVEQAEEST